MKRAGQDALLYVSRLDRATKIDELIYLACSHRCLVSVQHSMLLLLYEHRVDVYSMCVYAWLDDVLYDSVCKESLLSWPAGINS